VEAVVVAVEAAAATERVRRVRLMRRAAALRAGWGRRSLW